MAATAGSVVGRVIEPGEADAYHFCGHIFTTGSCPHPTGTPSIDNDGFPVHAADGEPVDNLGRRVNKGGSPVDKKGKVMRDPDGRPLPPRPARGSATRRARSTTSAPGSTAAGTAVAAAGSASSSICCAYSNKRINGDAALTGYCFSGRKVFCVMYFQTKVPC